MDHQSQLENKKYRNWVKAGLGLKYTKEGLEPFCDQLVKQQHVDILSKVKKKHSLLVVNCGTCDIKTLQPDHVRNKTKDCPLRQFNCNCQRPGGKIVCPNNVCGAIYDEIIQLHASTPPSPYWKNTDAKQWCTEPWAIAKSFINAPGYETKLKASEVDCVGLIHILINNSDFQSHLNCTTNGSGLLQKVRQYRNIIYHSQDMELDDKDAIAYIDDMVALLQDGKELINMAESKSAVDKLRELKREDFVITTTNAKEIHRAVMADVKYITDEADKQKYEVEQKGKEVGDQVESVATKQKSSLEQKGKEAGDQVERVGTKQKTTLEQIGKEVVDKVEGVGTKQKSDLEQKGNEVVDQVERQGTKQKNDLDQKGKEMGDLVKSEGTKQKVIVEQKRKEVVDQVESIGTQQKSDLEQKGKEVGDQIECIGTKQKTNLDQKGKEVGDQVENEGTKQKANLEQKGMEMGDLVRSEGTKQKVNLEQKGKEVVDQVESVGTKQKSDLEQKGKEVGDQVERQGTKQKNDLDQKGKEVGDLVKSEGTKQKVIVEQKRKEVVDQVESIGTQQKSDLEQKGKEVGDQIECIGTKQKTNLDQKGKEVGDQVENEGTKQKANLEQKGMEVSDQLERVGTKQKSDLEQKGKEVSDQVESIGTKQKSDLEQKGLEVSDQLENKGTELILELEQKIKRDTTKDVGLVPHELDYCSRKAEYQRKLVDGYMQYALQVSSLPLQPGSNQKHAPINKMYVRPWMTVEIWDETSKQNKEVTISMHEIFHNVDKPVRNIYVLGEAGSGKTTFCKMLVYYWCVAHPERKTRASVSSAVKVMENYDFLFHISLRHYSDLNKIEIMLYEIYPDPVLRTILQNEPDKCLILLDGLDEWTPQNQRPSEFLTPGLPTRDLHARYKIITTTRRWKFDTLRIKSSEIDKKITLKGICGTAVTELIDTTVDTLKEIFHKNRAAKDFLPALNKSPVADMGHVPMILQQLICLWFDDKLRGTSTCAIYSSMLDLFFDWNALKHLGKQEVLFPLEYEIGSRLPDYVKEYTSCFDKTRVIYHLSRLAYKSLFERNKENTLTFSNSTFQQLDIPGDVITCSLKVGILSEDQNIKLFASRRQHTSFSFVHKSMQEFLAAVYVAIEFETMIQSLDELQKDGDFLSENCKQFVSNHFGDCKTVADIFEQSNVFIILCGLEPQLLPYISEIIYRNTTTDKQITGERKLTKDEFFSNKFVLRNDIQKFIVSCVSEALSRGNQYKNSVYIADIVLGLIAQQHIVLYLHRHIFNLHSLLSLDMRLSYDNSEQDIENFYIVVKLLTECDSLKTVKYAGISSALSLADDIRTEMFEQHTAEIIARNKSTLETVSLFFVSERIVRNLIQIMPSINHLIVLQVSDVTISHEVCGSVCAMLEQSINLQQIQLDISCNKNDKHTINLTKHKQLQYLDLSSNLSSRAVSILASGVNTDNLDTCMLHVSSLARMKQMCENFYNAPKLKHLALDSTRCTTWYNADDRRTDCLVQLLPSLTSLSTVELSNFSFTDNIISRPSDMRNLKIIELLNVTMSMKTWRAFVDSLPALPQTACVRSRCLTLDDSVTTIRRFEAEQQYVRSKRESFRMTGEEGLGFGFVTKETELL